LVEPVVNGCSTAVLHRSVEQDQEVPIGIRVRLTPGLGSIEDKACSGLDMVECIADTLQEEVITISLLPCFICELSVSLLPSIQCFE
jgi:hypothetical protein